MLCVNFTGLRDTQRAAKTSFLECVCMGFWNRLPFEPVDWFKKDCPHQCGWATSNPLKTWIEQKAKERVNSFSAWAETANFCLLTSALRQELTLLATPPAHQFSGLWTWTELYHWFSWFPSLTVGLLGLYHCVSQFL